MNTTPESRETVIVSRHLDHMRARRLSPRTIGERRKVLSLLSAHLGGPLLDATARDMQEWAEGISRRLAAVSAASYISHARAWYAWAASAGYLRRDPAAGLLAPRCPRRIPRPVSEKDLVAALAAADGKVRAWLILAGWCGLRAAEIAKLRREDIADAAAPPVLIVRSEIAKGGAERIVPLSPLVLGELDRGGWLRGASGWLFPAACSRGPVSADWVCKLSARTMREAGVNATLHQLRHRFGTALWRATHDLRLVQELLGHRDVRTTTIYTAWDRPGASDAVAALPVP